MIPQGTAPGNYSLLHLVPMLRIKKYIGKVARPIFYVPCFLQRIFGLKGWEIKQGMGVDFDLFTGINTKHPESYLCSFMLEATSQSHRLSKTFFGLAHRPLFRIDAEAILFSPRITKGRIKNVDMIKYCIIFYLST